MPLRDEFSTFPSSHVEGAQLPVGKTKERGVNICAMNEDAELTIQRCIFPYYMAYRLVPMVVVSKVVRFVQGLARAASR